MGKRRFDILQVVKNLDGTDALTVTRTANRCESCGQFLVESEPFTLRKALVQCLVNEEVGPQGRPIPTSGPERYRRVKLALRIEDAKDEIRLSIDQIKEVKDLAPKFLSPVAQMRVWDILDPPEDEEIDINRDG